MSYGLKVWDSSGNVALDTLNRISRLINTYTINFPAGTYVVPSPGSPPYPYTFTLAQTILSTSYSELNGMTAASNEWSVSCLTTNLFAKIVDVSGTGRIIVYQNVNLDPAIAKSGTIAVFRF